MGAGYARALGGRLVHALGPEGDPVVSAILDRLAALGIDHRPIRVPGHLSDWTLLVTSGPFGDKLPIGFRGCHAALTPGDLPDDLLGPCDLRAVAALPNRLCERALRAPGAAVRLLAPAIRNAVDRDPPLASFADAVDLLTCNRREWERLDDRDEVARRVAVVAVTDGPDGARVMHRDLDGTPAEVYVDAFPRSRPPRDTNRAGEAFGSTLITALLDAGWIGGPVPAEVVSRAAARASAAAALVLDRLDFGFPEPAEVDVALRAGRVD